MRPDLKVEIYTRPGCGYCYRAKDFLDGRHIPYQEFNLFQDQNLFREMLERTGRRSVPQIIINGTPIGGYSDMVALDNAGELDDLLGQ